MRTKAAGAQAVLANPAHGGLVKVSVYDSGGVNPTDLSTLALAADPVLEVTVQEAVDGPRTATVVVQRQQGARSFAPLVTTGNPFGGTVVDVGRRVVITCAVVPPDSESNYETLTIFDGWVDECAWPDDALTLVCTDKTAKLRDTWIEVERAYGFATGASATKGTLVWAANAVVAVNDLVVPSQSLGNGHFYKVTAGSGSVGSTEPTWPTGSGSTVALGGITYTEVGAVNETGTAVETIIQQVLNDNGLSAYCTLQTPVSPSWLIRPYIQQRQSVADAIQGLVQQLGWRCRYEWSTGLGKYELTLRQPNRSATTPDKAILVAEELKTPSLGVDVYSIRNVCRVTYSDTAARGSNGVVPRKVAEVSDSASITKYGRRYMEVQEDSSSQIDSSTEAQRMAQAIVDDLKEPTLPMGLVFPVDPYLEMNDLLSIPADGLRFSSDQVLAVDSLTHRFSQGDATTEVHLRGKPAAARAGWLELDGRAKPDGVLPVAALDTVSATVSTSSSVVGGVCITLAYSLMKGASPPLVEVHISASSGFTPGPSTLAASGQQTSFTIAQLVPGKAYFGRIVPVLTDASGTTVRGSPGAEFSFTAGQAQAGHYSSTVTQSHLPLNGNFEHATDDLAQAPMDHWKVVALGGESDSWGAAGSVYYATDSTRGRCLTLRPHASQRGRVLSDPFEVIRGQLVGFALSFRRNTGTDPTYGLIFRVRGYSDSALTTLTYDSTDQIMPGTATPYAAGTWYDNYLHFDVGQSNFLQVEFRRQTISAAYSWDIGDVYAKDERIWSAKIDALDLVGAAITGTVYGGTFSGITVAEPSWTAPTFENSWANYDAFHLGAGYYKDASGRVHLRGLVQNPTPANRNLAIFHLPVGYRPAHRAIFSSIGNNLLLRVDVNGVDDQGTDYGAVLVRWPTTAGPETWTSLNGLYFDTR